MAAIICRFGFLAGAPEDDDLADAVHDRRAGARGDVVAHRDPCFAVVGADLHLN